MATIVNFPTVVQDALDIFGDCLPTNPSAVILPNTSPD